MGSSQKSVKEFALIGFILLAVLFGMQIMTFIFGNLGPESSGLDVGSEAYNVSLDIQNDSLRAIGKYAEQSGTQFTTLGIAITLILLVAVFLFFWKSFMGREKRGPGAGGFS